jgi:transposase
MRSVDFNHIDDVDDIAILRAMLIEQQANLIDRNAQLNDRNVQLSKRDAQLAQRDALIAAHERTISRKTSEIDYKTAKIAKLTAEIARLRRITFSSCSEKLNPEQRELFEETMAADIAAVEDELEALRDPSSMNKPRSPAVRRPLPPELPRVETVHEPKGCACGRCVGDLVKIGEHVRETLDCEPLKLFVRREVYPQYACRACETVVAEPVAPAILDRSIAAPALMSYVITSKYVDHLPLYRLQAIFLRSGVEISRTTLAEWVGAVGVRLQPLVDAMRLELHGCDVLHADETPVAQLDPGAGKTRRAYLFAYRSASQDAPIILFDYCTSRSGKHAGAFLDGWQGALMVDDYAGYKALFKGGIIELGCWAHARRKFFDLHKANKSEIAGEALQRIAALYHIEQQAREMSVEDRHAHRQRHARPLVEALFEWLIKLRPTIVGHSGTANAIDYSLKRTAALTRYLDDGRYPIDNNAIENAIRPIAVGRKNWLFAGSETAGRRAAAIMSLLATAKANGHCPHAWLTDVLTRLPTTLDKHIGELLPHRWVLNSEADQPAASR